MIYEVEFYDNAKCIGEKIKIQPNFASESCVFTFNKMVTNNEKQASLL